MRLVAAAVERIGLPNGRLSVHAQTRQAFPGKNSVRSTTIKPQSRLPLTSWSSWTFNTEAVGHRLVHGGADHIAPEQVEAQLLENLRWLVPYAPLHLPAAIQGIEAVTARFPQLPQVACFDTAFHRRMPELAQRFPLPRAIWDLGIRRYGFHGLDKPEIVHWKWPS